MNPVLASTAVPRFSLYGVQDQETRAERIHIELIETRSRIHNWHISRHTHAGLFQVLFLVAGQVEADIDDRRHSCAGPTLITIHPSVEHGFDFAEESQGFVLTIDQDMALSVDDRFAPLFVKALLLDLGDEAPLTGRLVLLMEQLLIEFTGQRPGHTAMLEWLTQCVMQLLVRLVGEQQSAAQSGRNEFELFNRFRTLLEAHYKEQWAVEQYARQLTVTPTKLNRLCLRIAQQSAFDLAQRRLMLEACRQLTYLPTSVAMVAYELGYQDPAYFSRAFKRYMGTTPTMFRYTTKLTR